MHVNLTRTGIHHQTHICQSHWALQDDAVEMVLNEGSGGGSDGSSDGGTEWNGISRMCMCVCRKKKKKTGGAKKRG